ncbi:MAG: nicotinamide riboside transporter PnuC [Aristaeellaceae bacterium]
MTNPIKQLSRLEWILWIASLGIVTMTNLFSGAADLLTLLATWIGVTALIFAAKGNVWAQILVIVFSLLYAIISWRFRYWGEMITYLGMTMPMAIWATVTWIRHPAENGKEVAIQRITRRHVLVLVLSGCVVTAVFYFLLKWFNTPNLVLSTVSITTSFFAAALTMLRSSCYALGYAANDVVLIALWTLAALNNPEYIPVVANFGIFLVNDLYGFISWKRRERTQQ